jgi:hypothetical protein
MIGEEHQAQAAQHGLESPIGQLQVLAVLHGKENVRPVAEALSGFVQHRRRDVDRHHGAARSDQIGRRLGGEARPRRDVQHAVTGRDTGQPQQRRDELTRCEAEHLVVAACSRVVEPIGHRGPPRTPSRRRR